MVDYEENFLLLLSQTLDLVNALYRAFMSRVA